MTLRIEHDVEGGTLTVFSVQRLGDVVLGDYSREQQRLAVLAPTEVLLDDGGMASHCFNLAVGARGVLTHSDDVVKQVWVFERVVEWLRRGHEVTIACLGGEGAPVLLALVLVAAGRTAPAAVAEVNCLVAGSIVEPDDEIPVSVFSENRRAQARRRS